MTELRAKFTLAWTNDLDDAAPMPHKLLRWLHIGCSAIPLPADADERGKFLDSLEEAIKDARESEEVAGQ